MDLNPSRANDIFQWLAEGSAIGSDDRYLMLTTDTGGTTETTDYDGRQNLSAAFGSPTAGDGSNNVDIGPFTFTAGDTIRGWAIMDDVSAGSYVLRGSLTGQPFVIAAAGEFTIAIGDLDITVDVA